MTKSCCDVREGVQAVADTIAVAVDEVENTGRHTCTMSTLSNRDIFTRRTKI
jgi:hypothetical protein